MGGVYLLSSLIVPLPFESKKAIIELEEVDIDEVRGLLKDGFTSAVGHKTTANFLAKLLGVKVDCDRRTISLGVGDIAIALQFKERVQGVELGEEELEEIFKKGGMRFLKMKLKDR